MSESLAEYLIAIPDQELGCFLVVECVCQLVGGPGRSGMMRHVEVNDLSSFVRKERQYIEQPKCERRDNQEVH